MFSYFHLRVVSYFMCAQKIEIFSRMYGQNCMRMACAIFCSSPRLSQKALRSHMNPQASMPCAFNISNGHEITHFVLASDPTALQG